jgi:hypothetical protein
MEHDALPRHVRPQQALPAHEFRLQLPLDVRQVRVPLCHSGSSTDFDTFIVQRPEECLYLRRGEEMGRYGIVDLCKSYEPGSTCRRP